MINHSEIKELISANFDGQTTIEERKLVKEHLKECSSCQEYSRQLHKLSATLNEWTSEDLSPDLEQKIQRGLKEALMSREKKTTTQHPLFKVGVGGGGVLVAILVVVLSMQVYNRGVQRRLNGAADDIGDQFSVDEQVQLLAHQPVQFHHGALAEGQQVADHHLRATHLECGMQLDVEQEIQVDCFGSG